MKRLLLFCTILFAYVSFSQASPITGSQALLRAQAFLNHRKSDKTLRKVETRQSRNRALGHQNTDYYYVFNVGDNQGFVIVSGDDQAPAILGYSNEGSFDIDNIPPNMAAWLEGYAEQIRYIQENNISYTNTRTEDENQYFAPVADLIQTQWDQRAPYNNECPEYDGKRCVTGCLPTAIAQVAYYHRYPTGTVSSIPGYEVEIENEYIKLEDLPETTFNWDLMELTYNYSSSAESQQAVAELMKYCGYGVQARYGLEGSSSVISNAISLFHNIFGYSDSIKRAYRSSSIPDSEWDRMIYHEISNGRPVLYNGIDWYIAHAFIVHGYDGEGRFKINWGWSGHYDGYFLLNLLKNIANKYDFSYRQEAVIGISPSDVETYRPKEDVRLTAYEVGIGNESTQSSLFIGDRDKEGNVSFKYHFTYYGDLVFTYWLDFGFRLYKGDEVIIEQKLINNDFFDPKATGGLVSDIIIGKGLENGDYQLKPCCKLHTDSEWKLCKKADDWILNIKVTDTKIYVRLNEDIPDPDAQISEEQKAKVLSVLKDYESRLSALSTRLDSLVQDAEVFLQYIDDLGSYKKIQTNLSQIEEELTSGSYPDFLKNSLFSQIADIQKKAEKIHYRASKEIDKLNYFKSVFYDFKTDMKPYSIVLDSLLNAKIINGGDLMGAESAMKELESYLESLEYNLDIYESLNYNPSKEEIDIEEGNYAEILKEIEALRLKMGEDIHEGITPVLNEDNDIIRRYNLQGQSLNNKDRQSGVIIIKQSNGRFRKVVYQK